MLLRGAAHLAVAAGLLLLLLAALRDALQLGLQPDAEPPQVALVDLLALVDLRVW